MKRVNLQISTFQGYGGIHWYGELVWYCGIETRNSVDITYRLSEQQAAEFNRSERGAYRPYKCGDISTRFADYNQLINVGVKSCINSVGKNVVLFEGSSSSGSPQKCLYAPVESLKNAFNELYDSAKAIGWYDGGNRKEMYEIDDKWDDLCKEWEVERF